MPRATNGKSPRGVFEKVKGSGEWWVLYYDSNGRRHREKVGPKSLAVDVYRKRKTEIKAGTFFPEQIIQKSRRTRIEDAIQDYLALKAHKRNHDHHERYARLWLKEIKGKTLHEIQPADIEEYQKRRVKEVAVATVNRELAFLKAVFNMAVRHEKTEKNPVSRVKMFKENNVRVRFLSEEEEVLLQRAFWELERQDEWLLVQIAMHTGMRRSEQFNLRWDNVNLQTETITIPQSKNGESRHITMSEYVWELFRSLPSRLRSEWCFPNRAGTGPVDSHNFVHRVFEKALERAGITNFHWHDLRHTFASRLIMAGAELVAVKEEMGHKSIQMTLRYSHLSPAHRRKAVNLLKPGVASPVSPAIQEPTATITATRA